MSDTTNAQNSELRDLGLLILAAVANIVAGIGALGMFSSMVLEDGGALFFSIAAVAAGAVGFRSCLKRHLAIEAADRASEG